MQLKPHAKILGLIFLLLVSSTLIAQQNSELSILPSVKKQVDEWMADLETWKETADSLAAYYEQSAQRNGISKAYILHKRGVVQYEMENYRDAIHFYQAAFDIRKKINEEIGGQALYQDLMRGQVNISGCYIQLVEPYEALSHGKEGLAYFQDYQHKDSISDLRLDFLLYDARAYDYIGDLDNAITNYKAIVALQDKLVFYDHNRQRCIQRIGAAYQELAGIQANDLADYHSALKNLEKAQALIRPYSNIMESLLPNIYKDLAMVYLELGKYDDAIAVGKQANKLFEEEEMARPIISNLTNLSIVYIRQGNLKEAEDVLNHALELAKEEEDNEHFLDLIYDNQSDLAFARNNYEESLALDLKAIQILLPEESNLPQVDIRQAKIRDKNSLLSSLKSLAETQAEIGDKEAALKTYQSIADLIDLLRLDYRPDASKGILAAKAKPIFADAIELCWQLYQQSNERSYAEIALLFSERSRSLILHEAVRNVQATAQLPPQLAKREQSLHQALNFVERRQVQLETSDQKTDLNNVREEVLSLRKKLNGLRDSIALSYPAYVEYRRHLSIGKFSILVDKLSEEHSYLEYFCSNENTFVFLLNGKENLYFTKLKNTANENLTREAIGELTQKMQQAIKLPTNAFFASAHEIYKLLFQPVEKWIEFEKLVIIPDQPLAMLSFEMLPKQVPDDLTDFSYRKFSDYLLYFYQISYKHAISFESITKTQQAAGYSFLGIAPAFPMSVETNEISFGAIGQNVQLVADLSAMYGKGASVANYPYITTLLEEGHQYKVIQFSTHASANNEQGDLSFVHLGDELLYTKDIYSFRLPATELVVLGMCQAGGGERLEGEGVISLSRAFFYAGCQAVVPTLWSVEETATDALIRYFHVALQKGQDKDEALRTAKLEYLQNLESIQDERAHPFYWAAIIPVGNMAPLSGFTQGSDYGKYLFFLAIGLALIFFIKKLRMR